MLIMSSIIMGQLYGVNGSMSHSLGLRPFSEVAKGDPKIDSSLKFDG